MELLLAAGADVRHVGPGGSTALHAAAAVDLEVVKSVGIVQRLLEVRTLISLPGPEMATCAFAA